MPVPRIALLFDHPIDDSAIWWTASNANHDVPQIIRLLLPTVSPKQNSEDEIVWADICTGSDLLDFNNRLFTYFPFGNPWVPIAERLLLRPRPYESYYIFVTALNQIYRQGITICLAEPGKDGDWGNGKDLTEFLNNSNPRSPEIVLDFIGINSQVEEASSCLLGGTQRQLIRFNPNTTQGLNNLRTLIEKAREFPYRQWAILVRWEPLKPELSELLEALPNSIRILAREPSGITEYNSTKVHIIGETIYTAEQWDREKEE